ncbi:hypothetical protein [Actinoplanes sp. NBRC 101535]|uniref:hypothetical protein n=1 Tax=Actinoplanes sp. NBRC 101535 TaxID=3032196 RepID=UPI0024A3BB46|nr:hypothetical protein [Actinoplanes sp. NBRC 101535]GLY03941.1 hypothetical protein Acsp01_43200 [Actinoplanes sp. NBRC 101535]
MRSIRAISLGTVLVLGLPACSSSTEPAASGTSTPSEAAATATTESTGESTSSPEATTSTEAASADDVLAGKRKVLIHIAEDDKDWSASYEGPVEIGDGTDDGALWKIVPAAGDKYLIEALRPREEGGRWCVKADDTTEPVSLGTTRCAENADTLFSVVALDEKDDKGRATYSFTHEKHGTVQVRNDGSALYIQQVGDGGARGSYSLVDRGEIK